MPSHHHGPGCHGAEQPREKRDAAVAAAADRASATPDPELAARYAPDGVIHAGLRSLDHYKRALPKWRYKLRQSVLPLIRWETPYLAYLQAQLRTPALDSYFAITANLGTHTFFMVGLPVLFWCGWYGFGKGLVHILASGVFFTGFIKDMCSLPRPLSPPLQRITMSGSAALEYGFPSTHSANAVSVAVYAVLSLRSDPDRFAPAVTLALELLSYFYAASIVFGRLYCGMHGFLDVVVGSLLGAAISLVEFYYVPAFETWIAASSYLAPLAVALLIVVLVRIHPEPADDCPCFDDSVAFAGVMIGLEIGTWRLGRGPLGPVYVGPHATFALAALGWRAAVARMVLGVLVIFAWREVMKPTLLRALPHVFRVIETHGLDLPRRFFVRASEYENVPLRLRDDNVLPNVSDLPKLVQSIRGPGRGRSVSIGPQSAADAYETLAYRERRRRESIGSDGGGGGSASGGGVLRSQRSLTGLAENWDGGSPGAATPAAAAAAAAAAARTGEDDQTGWCSQASGVQSGRPARPADFEKMMGQGTVIVEPASSPDGGAGADEDELYVGQQDDLGEKEVFSRLVKPRVRYDVEVVTKLVVYTGENSGNGASREPCFS